VLFDGIVIEARVARNKLGGSGGIATWKTAIDPLVCTEAKRREGDYVAQRTIGNVATL
jgi:hypothetical protein